MLTKQRTRAMTEENIEGNIAANRQNRMKLVNSYNSLQKVRFFDRTGSVARTGTVQSATQRGLVLKFPAGYIESFFYEELMELELGGKIEGIR